MAFQFKRIQTTPVLTKGSTYDGILADAIAAPGACWDGTRYAMTASIWNIATSLWSSIFLTSPDLSTWTYVSGSIRTPSSYLLGDGGLAWFGGKYWFVYLNDGVGLALDHSTDLLTWTNVPTVPWTDKADPKINIGPTGKLELWAISTGVPRHVYFADSPDGVTWTDNGIYLNSPVWNATDAILGAPSALVYGGVRYLVTDIASQNSTFGRMRALFQSPGLNTTWTSFGTGLGASVLNAWEKIQVFDGAMLGPFDRGDGRGLKFWLLYAGGDNNGAGDNTNSSIGLAYMDLPAGGVLDEEDGIHYYPRYYW